MKKFIALFIIFVLVIALSGCNSEDTPKNEEPDDLQEVSAPLEENEPADENAPVMEGNFYDEFGYTVTVNGETTRYYPTFMQNFTEVIYDKDCNPTVLVGGALTEEEVNSRPDILFEMPTENDEAMVMRPNTKAVYDLHGFIQNIYYEVPVGSGRYQLAPPEFDGVDDVTADFEYGTNKEVQTLAVGGKMGKWKFTAFESQYDEDMGGIIQAEGSFTGEVELEGTIKRNEMVEGVAYDLIISQEESDKKIPHYISPDGVRSYTSFRLSIPEGLENSPSLEPGQEMKCRVTVSEFRFEFAHRMMLDWMTVIKIEILE